MIYMTDEYQADETVLGWPLTHSRILWDNLLEDAAFSAGAVREGFEAPRAQSPDTVSWWWPTAAGVLTGVMPAAREIDCCAIAAHTIGSAGVSVTISARVAGIWRVVQQASPLDDEPMMLAFRAVTADAMRVAITGPAMVGVIYAGKLMVMPQPAYTALPPLALIRSTSYQTSKSVTGQFMGRSVESTSRPFEVNWSHLKEAWVREHFVPFILAAREAPFFIALRPGRYPTDVGYALTSGDIVPERMGVKDYMQVQINAEAHAGPEG